MPLNEVHCSDCARQRRQLRINTRQGPAIEARADLSDMDQALEKWGPAIVALEGGDSAKAKTCGPAK